MRRARDAMDQTGYTAPRLGGSVLAQGQARLQPRMTQVGQGPQAGSAPAQVQQNAPGQAGRPRQATPHSAADALAANPMHFTSGLAQTRGQNEQRHPTLMPGPKMGAGGNLSTLRQSAVDTNTGMQQGGTGARGYSPNVPPPVVSYAPPTPPSVTVPQNQGGVGQTSSGLTAGNTPAAQPGSYGKPGEPGGPRGGEIATDSGAMWDYDGDGQITQEDIDYNNWLRGQPFEGGQGILQPGTTMSQAGSTPGLIQQARDAAKQAAVDQYGPAALDPYTNAPPGSNYSSFEQWLQSMGDVPQLDRSALEGQIRAEDQRQALEDSRQLQAMAEAGARAGVDAGQAAGMQGEIGHQSAVERATRGANMRLQANVQNFQAQVQAYAQRHQAAMQAAQFAQSDKERADAMRFAEKMLAAQTAAQKELEKYQWELSKKMSWQDYAGTALAYHQSKSSDAHDAFGSFLGGKCDQRVKQNIRQDGAAILRALQQLVAYSFEYDLEEVAEDPGRFFGIMAQDLQKSEAGKTLVKEDALGHLRIDNLHAVPFLLAACSVLAREIASLREKAQSTYL